MNDLIMSFLVFYLKRTFPNFDIKSFAHVYASNPFYTNAPTYFNALKYFAASAAECKSIGAFRYLSSISD